MYCFNLRQRLKCLRCPRRKYKDKIIENLRSQNKIMRKIISLAKKNKLLEDHGRFLKEMYEIKFGSKPGRTKTKEDVVKMFSDLILKAKTGIATTAELFELAKLHSTFSEPDRKWIIGEIENQIRPKE